MVKGGIFRTSTGKAFLDGDYGLRAFLEWPGSKSGYDSRSGGLSADATCQVPNIPRASLFKTVGAFALDLAMPESEAKTFREKLTQAQKADEGTAYLQAAVVLTGAAPRQEIVCGFTSGNAVSGQVLAWRIAQRRPERPLTSWVTESNWVSPQSCAEAVGFFTPKPPVQTAPVAPKLTDAERARTDKTCVCSRTSQWLSFRNWFGAPGAFTYKYSKLDPSDYSKPAAFDASKLGEMQTDLKAALEKFDAELFAPILSGPGCELDNGARARMVPVAQTAREGMRDLLTLLASDEPSASQVEARYRRFNDDVADRFIAVHWDDWGCP
jgi:hypothetical protein